MPLLISPLILRERGLGQIDLARFTKKSEMIIELMEIKSSMLGASAMRGQRGRIRDSAMFLGNIFGKPIKFIVQVG